MNKVTERLKKMMLASMGIYVLDILVGIVFYFFNTFSNRVCCVIIGALLLVHGLFYLIRYIYDGLGKKVFAIDLIFGVCAVIFGLFTMFAPVKLISYYLLLYGIGLCIRGLEMMCYGLVFMKKHEEIFPLVTITALLIIIMAVFAIINPFSQFILALRLVSYFSIVTGLFGCMYSSLLKKRARVILDMYK